MAILVWSNRFETGIPAIDTQHKQLFQSVNDLSDSLRRGDPKGEVSRVLDFLISYTVEHFRTEETWMKNHGFPGLEEHKVEHAKLVAEVSQLKQRFDAGELMTMRVTIFLANWLKQHINESDLAYVEHSKQLSLVGAAR